jgi:hypothetical protein
MKRHGLPAVSQKNLPAVAQKKKPPEGGFSIQT